MIVGAIEWTTVIVAAIPTVPATLAVILANGNRRAIRTPSGDPIGHVVERTHDLAAVNAAALGTEAGTGLARSVERLNDDPNGPVHVNDETKEAGADAE